MPKDESRHRLYTFHNIELNVKHKTINLLEDKVGENGFSDDISDTSKA